MSEIPFFPTFDNVEQQVQLIDDIYYLKKVMLVAPFTMVNVSNEAVFSDKAPNEQIYVSRLPLFDNNYWFFDLISNNQINVAIKDEPYFFQQQAMLTVPSDVKFYFFNTAAPLYLSRINRQFKVFPYTYPSLLMHTGKVPNVSLTDESPQAVMLDVDYLNTSLDMADLQLINQVRLQQRTGLQGQEVK